MNNSLAESTRKVYQRSLNLLSKFRQLYDLYEIWPVPVDQLQLFLGYLSISGISASTMQTYLSGISYEHKSNMINDTTRVFIVQKILEGFKREKHVKDVRKPITVVILKDILVSLQFICTSHFETQLFYAAFLLAFCCFLRVGEVTLSQHALKRGDVSIINNLLTVRIQSCKTDQIGQGHIIEVKSSDDAVLCPVRAVGKYLQMRQSFSCDQLFCHANDAPLTRYQFSAVLEKTLKFTKRPDCGNFKSHSFRIGAATVASLRGIPDEEIKVMGRWKSDCFRRYIRINTDSMLL